MYLCYHRVVSCLQLSKYVVVLVCKFNQIRKFIFLFFLPSLLALVVFPPPSLHPSFLLKASQTGQKHPWHQERARRHSWRHSSHLHTAHRRRSMTQRKPWSYSFLYTLRSKSQYVCCSHNQHTISTCSHVRVTWLAHDLMWGSHDRHTISWGSHDWHTISCEGHMISVASDHVGGHMISCESYIVSTAAGSILKTVWWLLSIFVLFLWWVLEVVSLTYPGAIGQRDEAWPLFAICPTLLVHSVVAQHSAILWACSNQDNKFTTTKKTLSSWPTLFVSGKMGSEYSVWFVWSVHSIMWELCQSLMYYH